MNEILIIAEAGVNHNGDINIAKKMIDVAQKCGADVIKFQTSIPECLVSSNAPKADYQIQTTGKDESQLDMIKKLVLSFEETEELKKYCDKVGITFLSTPFDIPSIHFLNKLKMPFWKIPSGEITNYPYLVEIGKTGGDIVMSTGMATIKEIGEAMYVLKENGCGEITLLQCCTAYPAKFDEVNLKGMLALKDEFRVAVGYSDHTLGIEVAIAAAALGARMIEKHFTLDRKMDGPDQKASIEPDELKKMVTSIRNVEKSLGKREKLVNEVEMLNRVAARKSIVALCNIKKGEIFTEENITTKRPGNGICPMRWNEIIGKRASRDFVEDENIEL